MSEQNFTPKKYQDFISSFEAGINSGVAPQILNKNQLAFALNASIRGGFVKCRPPWQKKTLNFNGNAALQAIVANGLFQGAGYYRPDFGTESLIAQIAGHLIQFTEAGNFWNVIDISIPGDLNSATVSQVWMWQSEKWMIVQDGTGTLPIFFDGTTSRRSNGPSQVVGITAADFTVPPIGTAVTLTLTDTFTGSFNDNVIIEGEFYQPVQNPAGNTVALQNLNAAPGSDIPTGSQIVINAVNVGVVKQSSVAVNGVVTGAMAINMVFNNGGMVNLNIGDTVQIPGLTNPYTLYSIEAPLSGGGGTYPQFYTYFFANYSNPIVDFGKKPAVGALVTKTSSSPSVIVGATTQDYTAPALNATFTALISNPYTGGSDQLVAINGSLFLLSPQSIPPSGNKLTVINLTDEGTAPTPGKAPLKILSVPELPAGRMGAYGMGCNAVSLTDGISYIIGDVVGAASGSPALNYRDAVLKTTQNDFLAGGGSFRLPGTGDLISAMLFPPILDSSLGQGPLQIGTQFSFFSNVVPGTDPATWETLNFPIQTESLKDKGPLGQNSTVIVNSDTLFRSSEGYSSLILARRDFGFGNWGNKPISNEVRRILDPDDQTLLSFSSALNSFDNRFQGTAAPQSSAQGIIHIGHVSLNFDLLSSLRTDLPPSWEGVWTALNIFQFVIGRINGSRRGFAFTFNYINQTIELWELLREQTSIFLDDNKTPIFWAFETPTLFKADVKSPSELVELRDGEVYLSDIQGKVHVKVYYRPDYYSCWTVWNEFDVCQTTDAQGVGQPGYRMRIGLGEPSPRPAEIANNRPLRNGYFFQFRFEITGSCTFNGMRVAAVAVPTATFAPIEGPSKPCQLIDCTLPDDLRLYNIQGLPPVTPTPSPQAEPFVNNVVYLKNYCQAGLPYFFGANLPTWITVDTQNNQIIGAGGLFKGATQAAADAAAVAGLQKVVGSLDIMCGFYNTQQTVTCSDSSTQTVPAGVFFSTISQADANNKAIALANTQCANPSCSGVDTSSYKIINNEFAAINFSFGDPAAPGDTVWDGSFRHTDFCQWSGDSSRLGNDGKITVNGHKICARMQFDNLNNQWSIVLSSNFGGNCFDEFVGIKHKGTTPAGTYIDNAHPTIPLTVVPIS